MHTIILGFFAWGTGDLNSGLQAYAASTSLTALFPGPPSHFLVIVEKAHLLNIISKRIPVSYMALKHVNTSTNESLL